MTFYYDLMLFTLKYGLKTFQTQNFLTICKQNRNIMNFSTKIEQDLKNFYKTA